MRMRNKKHAHERMAAAEEFLVKEPTAFVPHGTFHIEVGCGKGAFIAQAASLYPEIDFLAVEKVTSVMVLALEKAASCGLPNLHFLLGDVSRLSTLPIQNKCSRIYLNFNDPWPRPRHAKRRLTAAGYLDFYKTLLTPDGEIWLKTDNVPYFNFSLHSLEENGFLPYDVTRDLHALNDPENIITEYESNFSSQGIKINRVKAKRL
ncbi:MAG: tRNA (guanosine(46)-N7)-methyltransferase TrmB [Clostridia bacterium]|nr:tRNA (guanosine(46)-N7)-methyltransferase TrmB [Clostridia bacterium]